MHRITRALINTVLRASLLILSGQGIAQELFIACDLLEKEDKVSCKYQSIEPITHDQVTVTLRDSVLEDISVSDIQFSESFPHYVLFLFDVSNPQRQNTVESNADLVRTLLPELGEHTYPIIATFDSEMSVIYEQQASSSTADQALTGLRAQGQATELYKNVIASINHLLTLPRSEKSIVILSDGKAEDVAITREEVIQLANENRIRLFSVGYSEKLAEKPFLQNLTRLSSSTGGLYIELSKIEDNYAESVLPKIKTALNAIGEIAIPLNNTMGPLNLKIIIEKDSSVLTTKHISFDRSFVKQSLLEIFRNFILNNKFLVLLSSVVIFIGIILGLFFRRQFLSKTRPHQHNVKDKTIGYLIDSQGNHFDIFKSVFNIGRNEDNDLVLNDDTVSGHHAVLNQDRDANFFVSDLHSSNGTIINQKVIRDEKSPIGSGDMIELGEVKLKFVAAEEPA